MAPLRRGDLICAAASPARAPSSPAAPPASASRSRPASSPRAAKVSLWDLNADALATAKEATKAADAQALDIADPQAVARAAMEASVAALGGKLDVLVASAGITGPNVPVARLSGRRLAAGDRRQPERPVLLQPRGRAAHAERSGYGRIVNIASIAGKEGNPNASAYSALARPA